MATSVTFTDSTSSASASSAYTFTARSIGTASSDRTVICAVAANGVTAAVSSLTIGGISAIFAGRKAGPGATSTVELWSASVPTGTTADVIVNFSGSENRCGIGLWAATGIGNLTPIVTGSSTASPLTTTMNIGSEAVIVGIALAVSATFTWSGATKSFDAAVGASAVEFSGAATTIAAQNTSYTVTATQTASSTSDALIVAVWGALSISGVSGTGNVGSVGVNLGPQPSGVSASGAVGSLVPAPSITPTGVSASGAVGAVSFSFMTGVAGSGVVGTLSAGVSAFVLGASGSGVVGALQAGPNAVITGVFGSGLANDVFPIPPAPATRSALLIPSQGGFPASLWLGSNNGN